MSYAQDALDELTDQIPDTHACSSPNLLRALYTLLVLTKGTDTTLEDVHDAWSLWRTRSTADHPALIPFAELSADVQELDRPYMEAIHRAAVALGLCRHAWDRVADDSGQGFPLSCLHCGLKGRLVEVSDVG